MRKAAPRVINFNNLESIAFEEIRDPKLKDYISRLTQIHHMRKIKGSGEYEKIDYVADGGKQLYDEVVEEIAKKLISISPLFKDKDERWCKAFKENFYKLFIDRLHLGEEKKSDVEPCYIFNERQINLEKDINKNAADSSYAEGFAVAFFFMLNCLEEVQEMDLEKFLKLFHDFNALTTVSNAKGSNANKSQEKGGLIGTRLINSHKEVVSRFKQMAVVPNQSNIFYCFQDGRALVKFPPEFNHQQCLAKYWKSFLEDLENPQSNKQQSIYDFADLCASYIHLHLDGNGRAAVLMGWFLSLQNNILFPVGAYPHFTDVPAFEEAVRFSDAFMKDPKIDPFPAEVEKLYYELTHEGINSHPFEGFLCNLLSGLDAKGVFCELGEYANEVFFDSYNDEVCVWLQPREKSTPMHIASIREAVAENLEEIMQEQSVQQRNIMILLLSLEKISEIEEQSKAVSNTRRYLENAYEIIKQSPELDAMLAVAMEKLGFEEEEQVAAAADETQSPDSKIKNLGTAAMVEKEGQQRD